MPAPSLSAHAHTSNLIGQKIDNNRFEFLSILGVGAYGVVYLAHDTRSEQCKPMYYAVKCLSRIGLDARQKSFQKRELSLHSMAGKHPHVVTLHKIIETSKTIFVIMEYCEEGDLFGMITERQLYLGNDNLVKHVFLQIIDAVQYCHRLGIYHRDLKPENILCLKGGSHLCIADFGLATNEPESRDYACGSFFYMSPECLGQVYPRQNFYSTAKNDIWSLGIILINLACGRNPWKEASPTDQAFRAYVKDANFLRKILPISGQCHTILTRIFTLDPERRISLVDLKAAVISMERFTLTEQELVMDDLKRRTRAERPLNILPKINVRIEQKPIRAPAKEEQTATLFTSSLSAHCLSQAYSGVIDRHRMEEDCTDDGASEKSDESSGPITPDFLPTRNEPEIATEDIDKLDGLTLDKVTIKTPIVQSIGSRLRRVFA